MIVTSFQFIAVRISLRYNELPAGMDLVVYHAYLSSVEQVLRETYTTLYERELEP